MKEIEGYPGYFITEDGRVWSGKRNIFMKKRVEICGYERISLYNGHSKRFSIHRLVIEHFNPCPDPQKFDMVNHIDGNKLNNHISNLEWSNNSHNQRSFINLSSKNHSGILGVTIKYVGPYKNYKAFWSDNEGRKHEKSFSVNKYGEDEAKRLAIDYRKKMEQLYYSKPNAQ